MSVDLDRLLDEAEYEELGEILQSRGDGDGMLLDALHGLITAIAIGPEPVPPDEWMPQVVDDAHPFDSLEQAERAIALILRMYNSVANDLDELRWEPILGAVETEAGDSTFSAQGWCEGFTMGVDLRADTWEKRMKEDRELMELLAPILALAGDEGVFESEAAEDPTPLSEAEYEDALNKLPAAVYDVHQYWRDHPPTAPFTPKAPRDPDAPAPPAPRRRGGRTLH
ncbi:MAG TPA: YecA family protein [Xanthomonadales bacterium]|nr:YecA family protein [Xanthomonadales bacterium]